ncbi:unnamed protein product [Ilex paraguariensis]|uniref:Uncharacterized protein n=1 Tax=Ilex paraguariensis TaxID=185542 RepID=A0ABC8RIY6_9AQUA
MAMLLRYQPEHQSIMLKPLKNKVPKFKNNETTMNVYLCTGNSDKLMILSPLVRRKDVERRAWLVVQEIGKSHIEEVGKHSIMRRTGIPARDVRVLDPKLSHPSKILGRERAIVLNLEHVKAIVTATEMLILNPNDPGVAPFVSDLEHKLSNSDGSQPIVSRFSLHKS